MSHRVYITFEGAGVRWMHPTSLEIAQWTLENTAGKYRSWWTGSTHKDQIYSDTMVIDFEEEQDAIAFKLKYVCNN